MRSKTGQTHFKVRTATLITAVCLDPPHYVGLGSSSATKARKETSAEDAIFPIFYLRKLHKTRDSAINLCLFSSLLARAGLGGWRG